MAPQHDPPGKPPAMPAEQFNDRIEQLMSLRAALRDAECVDAFGVDLDEDATVCGWAVLPDRDESAAFDGALADHNASLDARTLEPRVSSDGGKIGDPGVSVHFSEQR